MSNKRVHQEIPKHPVDLHIGQRLRLQRQLAGMSQSELGKRIGVTFQQVQKYERGSNRMSGSKLYEVSTVLGVTPSYFFEGLSETSEASNAPERIVHLSSADGLRALEAFERLPLKLRRILKSLILSIAEQECEPTEEIVGSDDHK